MDMLAFVIGTLAISAFVASLFQRTPPPRPIHIVLDREPESYGCGCGPTLLFVATLVVAVWFMIGS